MARTTEVTPRFHCEHSLSLLSNTGLIMIRTLSRGKSELSERNPSSQQDHPASLTKVHTCVCPCAHTHSHVYKQISIVTAKFLHSVQQGLNSESGTIQGLGTVDNAVHPGCLSQWPGRRPLNTPPVILLPGSKGPCRPHQCVSLSVPFHPRRLPATLCLYITAS